MWRPLRPRVKRELRRLEGGEITDIVISTKWEYDEVDRRIRRWEERQSLDRSGEEVSPVEMAEVIELLPKQQEPIRQLMVAGSDVNPGNEIIPGLRKSLEMRHARPNPPSKEMEAGSSKADSAKPPQDPLVDMSHLAELLEFVLWLVGENGITDVKELVKCIFFQFEIGTYSGPEIKSVLEVVLSETTERGST